MNLAVDARAATMLEQQAVRWVGDFVGYPAANGAFTSGGTISNVTALAAARERALPESRATGLGGLQIAVYASSEVHYSITRAVELLGIGSDHLRDIPIDEEHRMRPDLLAEAIDQDIAVGVTPVAVVATAGTTLTGCVDPIAAIADVCEERAIWLHVDGAYGLPAASVDPERFAGVERAHRSASTPTSGCTCRRRAASCWSGRSARCRGVRAPGGVPPASAARAPRRRHHARVLASAPGLEALARVPGARRRAVPWGDRRNLAEASLLHRKAEARADFETFDAAPQLSIVPIRHVPAGVEDLDAHNQALADAIQADGRVYLASALIEARCGSGPAS